jgi:hypothetical protein
VQYRKWRIQPFSITLIIGAGIARAQKNPSADYLATARCKR